MTSSDADDREPFTPANVAFVGNSMLYFNDTPRAFLNIAGSGAFHRQDSCLRGGASLVSLLVDGNGMQKTFRTPNAILQTNSGSNKEEDPTYDIGAPTVDALLSKQWDFVVMNDFTQAPARQSYREASSRALVEFYAPLFRQCGATPIFVMTPAYRKPVNDSADLGSVAEFTASLKEGYKSYVSALEKELPLPNQQPRIAPVGLAFLHIHDTNHSMWEKLFCNDDFHPSPHGTYLQCCVLHWTLFRRAPERDLALPLDGNFQKRIWGNARFTQHGNGDPLPLPTIEEANYLFDVAAKICQEIPQRGKL